MNNQINQNNPPNPENQANPENKRQEQMSIIPVKPPVKPSWKIWLNRNKGLIIILLIIIIALIWWFKFRKCKKNTIEAPKQLTEGIIQSDKKLNIKSSKVF